MADIKLVGLDLDGTLLDDDRRITPHTIAALEKTSARGIHLAIVSGRNFPAVPEEIRALPFMRYYVLCNGATLYDAQTDKTLYQAEIPLEQALDIYAALAGEEVYYDCYLSESAWTEASHYEQIDEFVPVLSHRAFLKASRTPFPDLCEALRRRGKSVCKVQAIYKSAAIRDAQLLRLRRRYPGLSLSTAYPYNLEFNSPDATKGQGLMQLARVLGLSSEQVMAFGDSGNDLTMLQSAGIGVAMGNACAEALAVSDWVAPPNTEDGVAQVLEALAEDSALFTAKSLVCGRTFLQEGVF